LFNHTFSSLQFSLHTPFGHCKASLALYYNFSFWLNINGIIEQSHFKKSTIFKSNLTEKVDKILLKKGGTIL